MKEKTHLRKLNRDLEMKFPIKRSVKTHLEEEIEKTKLFLDKEMGKNVLFGIQICLDALARDFRRKARRISLNENTP